ALVLDQVADDLVEAVARLLIWHLLDDDIIGPAFLDDVGPRPQSDLAAAGAVAIENALLAADDAPRRKIGPAHQLDELIDGDFGIVDDADDAVADFAQVVGRDLRGHADGDAVRAIDEQI